MTDFPPSRKKRRPDFYPTSCFVLCSLNFIPVAVFNNGISFGNDYLALADAGVGRIELIESSALNGDLGIGAVLAVKSPFGCYTLKGTAVDYNFCCRILGFPFGVDKIEVIVVVCGNTHLSEVAAVYDDCAF